MNKNLDEIAAIERQAENDIHVAIQDILDKTHDKGVCINDISFSIAEQEILGEELKKPIVCGVQARSSNRDSMMTNNDYYHCTSCGIEINGDEVEEVVLTATYANGDYGLCPDCGNENKIERAYYE